MQNNSPLPSISISKKPPLLLDTNIIIYLSQSWLSNQIRKELVRLVHDYYLITSKINRYEIIKNSQLSKESKLLKLLNLFESFEITEDVIITAALLSKICFSKMEEKDKQKKDMDMIIAGTTVVNNSFLLTVNRNDFPFPYFEEKEVVPILYKQTIQKTQCILLCLLKPNIKYINEGISKIN